MTVGVVLSVLGEFASIFSLSCLTVGTWENSTKAKMSLGAGIMFISAGRAKDKDNSKKSNGRSDKRETQQRYYFSLARYCHRVGFRCIFFSCEVKKIRCFCISNVFFSGVCGVVGASIYAHQLATSSRISTYNSDKIEYGGDKLDGMGMIEEIPT